MSRFVSRLQEPSSWAGLAAIIGMAGQALATKDPQAIGAVVAGVLAFVMPERAKP